jgi:hypothetical protein
MAGDHDDGGVWELLPAHADQVEPVHIANAEVHDDKIRLLLADGRHTVDASDVTENGVPSSTAELTHQLQNCSFVVYDYQFRHKVVRM